MTTWTKEAVLTLIDAFKNEPCLYQTKNPNYHNKNLRNESLECICAIVNTVKPNTTSKECAVKFYNLRSQFNSENAKVRASIKSGIGNENVYRPNLWYYDTLKFLEEYIIPRKSKTSCLSNARKDTPLHLLQHDYSQASQESQEPILNEILFEDDSAYVCNEEDLNNNNEELCMSSSNNINTTTHPILEQRNSQLRSLSLTDSSNINTSSPSSSYSIKSSRTISSNVCSDVLQSSSVRNPRKRKSENDDVYVDAVKSIARSLKTPLPISTNVTTDSTDPVDTCMSFLGSLLKKIQSPDLKLDIMNTLVQTVINASATDLSRAKG